ncbi:hypothetical protein [Corynebacterium mayonis]|uniref:hypothetical protein n=1 Tax=Corynebacterium mayonis TaxID=3062461 RepID=UPI0031402B4F
MLSDEDYRQAESTVFSAFFTDNEITRAMWDALGTAGYTRGSVLEPGCGKGTFISTAPPGTHAVGVELDPTTARIASLLNPAAQIRAESFVDPIFADNTSTATIGNVPFVNSAPYAPTPSP